MRVTEGRRRFPSSRELAIWREHIETFEVVRGRIEARLLRDAGLSTGDYRVLLALSEADAGTLRSSELAARIEWERSRLSAHLGRMERRGLLRREPCPEDARGSNVVLTPAGADAFHGSTRPHLLAVREIFLDAFEPEELERLGGLTARMRRHLAADAP